MESIEPVQVNGRGHDFKREDDEMKWSKLIETLSIAMLNQEKQPRQVVPGRGLLGTGLARTAESGGLLHQFERGSMISRHRHSVLAALTLMVGLNCNVANAARQDGAYFEAGPTNSNGQDLSPLIGYDVSTADVEITDGVLKLATTSRYAIYADGTYWISNTQLGISSIWSATNREALRKDFPHYPAYRVKLWFYPTEVCTGYLAVYSSRGKLMMQKTFTSSSQTVLDTGALKGRIGYILATYGSECGRLGKIGYYYRLN